MPREALQGAAETAELLEQIPQAAREELGVDLAILGRDYLALQQARVPKQTGRLEAALGVLLLLQQLRVRVGLVGPASKQKFYGRVIDKGRRAQTVLVQRRRAGATKAFRGGRKRVEDIVATYRLRVRGEPARPFVDVPDSDLDGIAAQRLADFWGRTFARAGV